MLFSGWVNAILQGNEPAACVNLRHVGAPCSSSLITAVGSSWLCSICILSPPAAGPSESTRLTGQRISACSCNGSVNGIRRDRPDRRRMLAMRDPRSPSWTAQEPDLCTDLCTRRGGPGRDGGRRGTFERTSVACLPRLAQWREIGRDARHGCRTAHNPATTEAPPARRSGSGGGKRPGCHTQPYFGRERGEWKFAAFTLFGWIIGGCQRCLLTLSCQCSQRVRLGTMICIQLRTS